MATKKAIRESIKRIKSWYSNKCPPEILADELKVTVAEAKEILATIDPIAKKPEKKVAVKKIVNDLLHGNAKKFLPIGAGLISLISLGRSIAFTFTYFLRTDSPLSAVLMSGLFALVAFLSPAVAILAYKMKRWAMFVPSLLVFLLFASLNIYITVQELNISKTYKEVSLSANEEIVLKARNRVIEIDKEVVQNTITVNRSNKEYEVILTKSNNPDLTKSDYNRHRDNLTTTKNTIAVTENAIKELNNEKTKLTQIDGYYTMKITTEQDSEEARSMDTVYAISLEVVGPVFLVFALFL